MVKQPTVAAVVPTHNRCEKTLRFLAIALAQTYSRLTVVVVDAASADGTAEVVQQQYPQVVLLTTRDRDYWSATVNVGVRYALTHGFDYILTINDDSVIEPEHLDRLVALAERRQLKIVGNRIDYLAQPGQIWALGTYIRWGTQDFLRLAYCDTHEQALLQAGRMEDAIAVDTLPGNGALIHRQVFETVGLYNATWLPHYHADSELILRAQKAGFEAYVAPHVILKNDFSAAQKRVCLKSLAGLQWTLFAKKSHLYAPAIIYIVLRYAPWSQKLRTLTALLGRMWQMGEGKK